MKWALVLGGSSGLGLACARRLANDGYALCVAYREPRQRLPEVQAAFDELRGAAPAFLDLNVNALSEEGIAQVLQALSDAKAAEDRVHVVLHSIARGCVKPVARPHTSPEVLAREADFIEPASPQSSPEDLYAAANLALRARRVRAAAQFKPSDLLATRDIELTIEAMGTNLFSWVSALFSQGLLAEDTRVVGLTSEGSRRVWRGYAAVSAAKAALEAIVRALAVELGPYGVRANLIQAGITDTASLRHIPEQELLKLTAIQRNPLGRLTQPSDVANALSLLCRPEAAWINGATLVVDGGEQLC
jgi:NAD(P)-dependent dehydrogenase (short-subunit alcohol dehydrogenase family)